MELLKLLSHCKDHLLYLINLFAIRAKKLYHHFISLLDFYEWNLISYVKI